MTQPKVDNKCIEFMKTWDPMLIDDNIPWTDEDKEVMYNDIKNLLTQTQQETLEWCEKETKRVIDSNKLPEPNPYGNMVRVSRVNDVILDKVKSEICQTIKKKMEEGK